MVTYPNISNMPPPSAIFFTAKSSRIETRQISIFKCVVKAWINFPTCKRWLERSINFGILNGIRAPRIRIFVFGSFTKFWLENRPFSLLNEQISFRNKNMVYFAKKERSSLVFKENNKVAVYLSFGKWKGYFFLRCGMGRCKFPSFPAEKNWILFLEERNEVLYIHQMEGTVFSFPKERTPYFSFPWERNEIHSILKERNDFLLRSQIKKQSSFHFRNFLLLHREK